MKKRLDKSYSKRAFEEKLNKRGRWFVERGCFRL